MQMTYQMSYRLFLITSSLVCLGLFGVSACKSNDGEVTALKLPDSLEVSGKKAVGSGSREVQAQQPDWTKQTDKLSRREKEGESSAAQMPDGGGTSVPIGMVPPAGERWWDYRSIFFIDYVGNTGAYIHESIKGQRYFPETKIFVYSTDKSMEGTPYYDKIAGTFTSTELDDRIFIWVHLDEKHNPVFKKTLVSDNIKDKLDQAPLTIN